MPLPTNTAARTLEWPPPSVADYVRQAKEWAAWWAGDVEQLRATGDARRFWRRIADADKVAGIRPENTGRAMHAALAADMVSTSADLLFGDPVDLRIPAPEATGDTGETTDATTVDDLADGDASLNQETAAVDVTQARLDELRDLIDLDGTLLVAAETASALGGVWLRPLWDRAVADHPLLTTVEPEYAVPEYRLGQLVAVTFWQEVELEPGTETKWRHLERHEVDVLRDDQGQPVLDDDGRPQVRGVILNGLYKGTDTELGTPQDLTAKAATATLLPRLEVPEAAGPIMPRYMPNVLPNRRARRLPVGRSDFDGVEDGLDAIDEVWSSLIRDIRLGKARLMVPEGTLTRSGTGPGSGRGFNTDAELMVETDAAPDEQGGRVTLAQGGIRDASHLATIRALTEWVVSTAGYAPATFGLGIDGAAESGTARAIRERKTFRTLNRKRRYAARAVADVALALLALDVDVFERPGVVPMRPRVGWPDVTAEARTTAERLQLLRTAQAISIRNAVREAQPELTDTEVDDEVAAIMAELGTADPDGILLDRPGPGADDLEPADPLDGDPAEDVTE